MMGYGLRGRSRLAKILFSHVNGKTKLRYMKEEINIQPFKTNKLGKKVIYCIAQRTAFFDHIIRANKLLCFPPQY